MSDGLRLLRWRAAVLAVGLGLVFAWVHFSGRTAHTIQIDWTWGQHVLDSARVEIDGEVVGVLAPYGRGNYVTGFRVEAGTHVVRVLHDDCVAVPDTLELGASSGRVAIRVADYEDDFTCRVVLRGG